MQCLSSDLTERMPISMPPKSVLPEPHVPNNHCACMQLWLARSALRSMQAALCAARQRRGTEDILRVCARGSLPLVHDNVAAHQRPPGDVDRSAPRQRCVQ